MKYVAGVWKRWYMYYGNAREQKMSWGESSISFQKSMGGGGSFLEIFEVMTQRYQEDLELFAITTQRLWTRRNEVIHDRVFLHPNQIVNESGALLKQFKVISE